MKKILETLSVVLILSSCQKEETYSRNYIYPTDKSNPTQNLTSGNILVEVGENDENIMKKVRQLTYEDFSDTNEYPYIFLSPYMYSQSENKEIDNPNPKYMLFPHSINSTSDKWGWNYFYELQNLIKCRGHSLARTSQWKCYQCRLAGEQEFCDKYLNGERTLGMILDGNY